MLILLALFNLVIFTLLQALFVALEIAYVSSSPIKIDYEIVSKKVKYIDKLSYLLSNPSIFLSATLIGINFSMIINSSIMTFLIMRLGMPHIFIVDIILTFIIVIFAELLPKNLGLYLREKLLFKSIGIFFLFQKLLYPVIGVVNACVKIILKILRIPQHREGFFIGKDELKIILREILQEGSMDLGEKEAIERILDFRSRTIKDIYTPIEKVKGVHFNTNYNNIIEIFRKYKFTRYPVFLEGDIIGYINVFDVFYNLGENFDWYKCIRKVLKFRENQRVYDVFKIFKDRKENIGIVMRGQKIVGLITIDDLLKEITGNILKYS